MSTTAQEHGGHAEAAWRDGVNRLISYRYLGTFSEAHGRHEFDLAEFGLEPDQVRERFGPYLERFADEVGAGA